MPKPAQHHQKHTPGFANSTLGSFLLQPEHIVFETQEPGEQVILFLRQHWIVNVPWIAITLFLLFIPLLFESFILTLPLEIPPSYLTVLPLLWYLGVFGYAFVNFLYWYFNIYIVTNERVVDIDWVNLLYKQISTAKLDKIEDVTSTQGGVIGALFDFGNVHIQTAGTERNFEFIAVPHPNQVVKEINELIS